MLLTFRLGCDAAPLPNGAIAGPSGSAARYLDFATDMFGQLRRIALKLICSSRAIGEREVAIRYLKATLNFVLTGTRLL
jgi:hypothetical protein